MESEDKILFQFIDESLQNLQEFERHLYKLEENPQNLDVIQSLYRNLHTIKGGIGFFSMPRLELLVHKAEDIFNILSNQDKENIESNIKNHELINLFFKFCDYLSNKIKTLKEQKPEALVIDESLLTEIDKLKQILESTKPTRTKITNRKAKLSTLQKKALAELKLKKTEDPEQLTKINLDENIIIKPAILESIAQLNSELLLAKNQMTALINKHEDEVNHLVRIYSKIDNLSQRITEYIDQIRLQPISLVTDKLKRIIRDLSKQFTKEINLKVIGADLEVDRTILTAIKDPLVHIIRNSIDHGIEPTERRKALNKPIPASIKIEIKYNDNKISIIIEDDGAGINSEKVLAKAINSKLLTQEEANNLTDDEINDLIFYPGFSTADEVSNISGRGIGLDILKTNIAKINGSIELRSIKGSGTSFHLLLPMTLASETALIFEAAGHNFALSQDYIQTINTLQPEDLIDHKYIDLEEERIELLDFNNIFVDNKSICSLQSNQEYIIIDTKTYKFALLIDSVIDLQNIVIKPLPESASNWDLYSGSTILPNGSVALILSPQKFYEEYKLLNKGFIKKRFFDLGQRETKIDKAVSFRLGNFKLALDYNLVQEISTTKTITKLPGSNKEGLINLHDNVVLTKDLPAMIGLNNSTIKSHVEIVVKVASNTFAIQADDIEEILYFDDDIEQCSIEEDLINKYAVRGYLFQGEPVYLLDETKILTAL